MDPKLYSDFYKTDFGQEILRIEVEYLTHELKGSKRVLSIGCGPALHEILLAKQHPDMEFYGLDISRDMLFQAAKPPTNMDLILSNAEQLCVKENCIDLIYFIFSFEFISDIETTLEEVKRVLMPHGTVIFMVSNIESWYIQKELSEADSYIRRKLMQLDSQNLQNTILKYLVITSTEFMLGIRGEEVFDSEDPKWASLLVIKAVK